MDPNQIHEVRETIRKLGQNKTILLSTHILQEVEAMANRVLFIDEGRMVFDGPISELTSDGQPMDVHFRELTGACRCAATPLTYRDSPETGEQRAGVRS